MYLVSCVSQLLLVSAIVFKLLSIMSLRKELSSRCVGGKLKIRGYVCAGLIHYGSVVTVEIKSQSIACWKLKSEYWHV